MIFEYRSDLALGLARSGTQSLWLGGLFAVVFIVCAGVLLRLLEERAAAAQREAQRERLASLGEMSAVLAHEIRTPLTSLKGHGQLLSEASPEAGPVRKKADRMVREVVRLEALVNDLLDFVRAGAIEAREVVPAELLREAVELVGSDNVRVVVDAAPERWSLDPTRMRRVWINLIQNACQANPEAGDESVTVTLAAQEDGLLLEVSDQGPGLVAGEEERIFEPFVTGRAQGTGLGLAVARRLVELHGGRLTAANRPGGGACFRVLLPPLVTTGERGSP